MKCPKCSYVRAEQDTAPDYECPHCGIIYEKYRAPSPPDPKKKVGSGTQWSARKMERVREADNDGRTRQGSSPIAMAIGAILFFAVAWSLLNSQNQKIATNDIDDIYLKVAKDAVEQYEMVERHGSSIDKCVQAGLVSAAYLQAKRESQYQSWKKIEEENCKAAGI